MVEEKEGKLVIYHAETVHAVIFPKHLEFSEYVNNWITTGIKQYQIPLVHTHTQKKPTTFHMSHKEISQFHNS